MNMFPWLTVNEPQHKCKYCGQPASYVPDSGFLCEGCIESVERWEQRQEELGGPGLLLDER